MTDTHACPAPGCPERLPFERFACRPHWYALLPRLRARLTRAWASGDLSHYMEVRDEAVAILGGAATRPGRPDLADR